MKKKISENSSEKSPLVKEISDGVYINLKAIKTGEIVFEQAIERSFEELNTDKVKKSPAQKSTVPIKPKKD